MNTNAKPQGIVAAPHTPMTNAGDLNLDVVPQQAQHFEQTGVVGVFCGGTTGEALSLSCGERIQLNHRWAEVGKSSPLRIIAHVGSNCVPEARQMAAEAEKSGVDAIAAFAPSFFRPNNVEQLIDYCRQVCSAAPNTDFYFYNIPIMTFVQFSMVEFLEKATGKIPRLVGLKFTENNLPHELECVNFGDGQYEIFHGFDQTLLAALSVGVRSAVGSTYNFAARNYVRLIEAFDAGNIDDARKYQAKSIEMINILEKFGFAAASKSTMEFIGIDCGPVRAPLTPLSAEKKKQLRLELEELGVFE